MSTHHVIIIPGLGDAVRRITWLTNHWRRFGLTPIVYPVFWYTNEPFDEKLKRCVSLVDQLYTSGDTISLVGASAGASAVLNTYMERKSNIHKVIAVCGRLRSGDEQGFRSLATRSVTSYSFAQSVRLFENQEKQLTHKDREKIMTVRALFGDELVPEDTATIRGAKNIIVPTPEHVFSIAMALTLFSRPLISFLTSSSPTQTMQVHH